MKPQRIQLSQAKGWKMPPNTKKVDRTTQWGNPFNATQTYMAFSHKGFPIPLIPLHTKPSLERCLDLFAAYLRGRLADNPDFLEPLRGKNLGCWCKPSELCHADVLLRLANEERQ